MNKYLLHASGVVFLFSSAVFAQETEPSPGGSFLIMMIPILLIVYFLMIRPEQKKQKARQAMLQNVKKGDKVLTVGGIVGVITNVKDSTLMIKIGDNTVVEMTKTAVSSVLNGDGTEKKL
ncbi:preprotein translocase subunit YajC [Chitinispirillales bacterium ANBcel5]|uniref:preprotein translocase subunit YajC n=1 Tax=Cellulosispirillum alkaliphilum TaxID=3039283 RepID=UPI002A4ECCAB|nr:preprotein translocase subunit YajC [Chitinispirillales bacterium ANBcel5]